MFKEYMRKEVGVVIIVMAVIFLLILFGIYKQYHDYEPPIIKNVSVGLNFGPKGELIFVDENGEIVKPIPLKAQIDRKCDSKKDWEIEEVTTITVYRVTGSKEVWYVEDGMSTCYLYSNDYKKYLGNCP